MTTQYFDWGSLKKGHFCSELGFEVKPNPTRNLIHTTCYLNGLIIISYSLFYVPMPKFLLLKINIIKIIPDHLEKQNEKMEMSYSG
jgi:hypothetical protein